MKKLDPSIRYHFGIRPVSYQALSDAVGDFVKCLTDYSVLLKSLDGGESPAAVASQSTDLQASMRALDVQYGIWEGIVRESREPILRVRRAQLGRDGANPFIAMRRELQLVGEQVGYYALEASEAKRVTYAC